MREVTTSADPRGEVQRIAENCKEFQSAFIQLRDASRSVAESMPATKKVSSAPEAEDT